MVHITRAFDVPVPAQQAVDYLADFGHATAWDPGTVECTRVDSGRIAVGARWHNVSRFAGMRTELDYRLTELTDTRVVFTGTNKTATSTDDITVTPTGLGCRITYDATIRFNGAARFADPLMGLLFRDLARKTVAGITRELTRARPTD